MGAKAFKLGVEETGRDHNIDVGGFATDLGCRYYCFACQSWTPAERGTCRLFAACTRSCLRTVCRSNFSSVLALLSHRQMDGNNRACPPDLGGPKQASYRSRVLCD